MRGKVAPGYRLGGCIVQHNALGGSPSPGIGQAPLPLYVISCKNAVIFLPNGLQAQITAKIQLFRPGLAHIRLFQRNTCTFAGISFIYRVSFEKTCTFAGFCFSTISPADTDFWPRPRRSNRARSAAGISTKRIPAPMQTGFRTETPAKTKPPSSPIDPGCNIKPSDR